MVGVNTWTGSEIEALSRVMQATGTMKQHTHDVAALGGWVFRAQVDRTGCWYAAVSSFDPFSLALRSSVIIFVSKTTMQSSSGPTRWANALLSVVLQCV